MSDSQPGYGYPPQGPQQNPSTSGPQQNPYSDAPQQNPYTGPPQGNPYAGAPQGNPYAGAPQQYPYAGAPQSWPAPAAQGDAPPPRRRGLSTGGVLAIVFGAVGLVVIAGVVLVALVIVGVMRGETANTAPSAVPTGSTGAPTSSDGAYDLIDRPAYAAYVRRLTDMTKKYSDARIDGTIHQWVPATQAGDDYATAFVYILTDLKGATYFAVHGMTTDDDPAKLDAQIDEKDAEVTELERKFLAGEPFGTKVTIKRSDGTVFTYDGQSGPNG